MAVFRCDKIVILAMACFLHSNLVLASKTNPIIEACPWVADDALSNEMTSSLDEYSKVTKYTCDGDVSYVLGPAAASDATNTKITFDFPYWTVSNMATDLTLTTVPTCGVTLSGTVTCDKLEIFIGSKAGGGDASRIRIGSQGSDALVQWSCKDSSGTPIDLNYYFLVNFDGTVENAATSVSKMKEAKTTGNQVIATTDFDPNVFQKFEEVDNKAQIYLLKDSNNKYHTLFKSDQTVIKFKSDQYLELMGVTEDTDLSAIPAYQVCDKAVRLCFDGGCQDDGTASLSLGVLVALIPFIATFF